MCDKIKEGDNKYSEARATLEKTGCIELHDALELCLQENNKDWRKCQVQVSNFGKCVRLSREQQPNNPN